jgi:hypothetical protein
MEPQDPIAKLEYWKEHLKKLAEFDGSQTLYAHQNGISAAKLSYWKYKLTPKPKPAPSFTKVNTETVVTPKVTAEKSAGGLPDAKWLAIFLKELFR